MSAFENLRARVARAAKALGEPVPGAAAVVPSTVAGRPLARAWATDSMLRIAAKACESAANCLVFRADGVAKAPLGAWNGDEFLDDHELTQLFARASAGFLSQSDFWHQLVYTLDTDQNGAYVVAPLDSRGLPTALWVRSSADVRPIPDKVAFISGYQMRVDNLWRPVDPTEYLVWQHRFVPLDVTDLYGSWPPLYRAARAVQSYEALGAFVSEILRNKAVLDGFITPTGKDQPGPDASKAIEALIAERFNGPTKASGVEFLPGNMDFVKVGSTLADVNPGEIEDRLEAKIAASFGLNAVSVRAHAGMTATSSLGGDKVQQLIRQDYEGTISSLWTKLANDVAVVLAPLYKLSVADVRFNLEGVRELQESPDAKIARARLMQGWARINDQLRTAGLEEIGPDGDVIPIVAQLQAFGAAREVVAEASGSKAVARPTERKAASTGELLRKEVDTIATALEPAFAKAARTVFAAQREAVAAVLADAGKGREVKIGGDEAEYLSDELEAAIHKLSKRWRTELAPQLKRAQAAGASAHAGSLNASFNVGNAKAVEAVANRVTKITGHVDATTVDAIREAVMGARDSGLTLKELGAAIEQVFDAADDYRASMIARTECLGAANEGGFLFGQQVAEEDGLPIVKAWIAFMDEATRPSHVLADVDVPIDEPFTNGLMYPGDPDADAEEVINCRCSAAYYVAGDVDINPVADEVTAEE